MLNSLILEVKPKNVHLGIIVLGIVLLFKLAENKLFMNYTIRKSIKKKIKGVEYIY